MSLFLYNGPERKNAVTVTYVFTILGNDGQVINENKSTKPWNYRLTILILYNFDMR